MRKIVYAIACNGYVIQDKRNGKPWLFFNKKDAIKHAQTSRQVIKLRNTGPIEIFQMDATGLDRDFLGNPA